MQREVKRWQIAVFCFTVVLLLGGLIFAVYKFGPVGKNAAPNDPNALKKTPMAWRFGAFLKEEYIREMRIYDPSKPWSESDMAYTVLEEEEAAQILALLQALQQRENGFLTTSLPTEESKAVDGTYKRWWIWYEHPSEPYDYRNIGIKFTDDSLFVFEAASVVREGRDLVGIVYPAEPADPFDYMGLRSYGIPTWPEQTPPGALTELGNLSSELLWKYYQIEYPRWYLGKFIYDK